jgi:hypothetical protein
MKLQRLKATGVLLFGLGILGAATAASGCTASASVSAGITPPNGCQADSSVDCSGGGDGFSCDTGDNPEDEDATLSCSTPQSSAGEDDYCCFTAPSGFSGTTCAPDDDLTSVCPDPDSYGYQCASGDDPTSYDATLNCSTNTPDPDGVHDDYCCDYGSGSSSGGGSGSSSGGTIPNGCTADSTLDCVGGADGYSCTSGDNPEEEDTTLSCSTPVTDSDGNDDYCCYGGGTWSSTTCEPDDDLTSVCPDPTSYGYQCDSGDDPTSYDSTLNCSTNTPDPDGVHDDYCCTY